MNDLDLDLNLSLDFEYEAPAPARTQGQARAMRARNRHIARRAKSEAVLSEILPTVIEPGDSWHVLSAGDVEQLETWVDEARIGRLDAYVGEIFPGQYAEAHERLCLLCRRTGGRVAVFKNHSKLFLARSGDRAWVVETSANINTNPRAENATVTADWDLYQHHKAYLDGIRSFERNFDDWTPES